MAVDVYRLGYRWIVPGPIDTVFRFVGDARTYRQWFTVFREVHPVELTGPVHVGSHCTMRVKALLPYDLDWDVTVVRHEPPRLQEVAVKVTLDGKFPLDGRIQFRLEERPDGTVVVYNQQELTSDMHLPRFLHGIAEALFRFNHHWAMRQALPHLRRVVLEARAQEC